MAHSQIKIWIHCILGTKNYLGYIKQKVEPKIHEIIKDQLVKTGCVLKSINGISNHVHLLFLLHPDKNIREVLHQIKGGSSYEINRSGLISGKFNWQIGFSAYSVSESGNDDVGRYIQNQKEHHKKMTFEEEYQKFIRLYGFDKNG